MTPAPVAVTAAGPRAASALSARKIVPIRSTIEKTPGRFPVEEHTVLAGLYNINRENTGTASLPNGDILSNIAGD